MTCRKVISSIYDTFPIQKIPNSKDIEKQRQNQNKQNLWKRIVLRRQRLFLEIEYLEELYEEISIFISRDKTITIDVSLPKRIEEVIKKPSGKFEKMPILAICRGIDSVIEERKVKKDVFHNIPEKMTFVIPADYPLVPPFVYINDNLYLNIINCCHLERVKDIVGKYVKTYRPFLNCLSCACLLKRENWNTVTMFSDIFLEWHMIRRLKEIVGYELVLEDIMIHRGLEYFHILCILEYLIMF